MHNLKGKKIDFWDLNLCLTPIQRDVLCLIPIFLSNLVTLEQKVRFGCVFFFQIIKYLVKKVLNIIYLYMFELK